MVFEDRERRPLIGRHSPLCQVPAEFWFLTLRLLPPLQKATSLRASSTRLTAARQSTRLETPFNRHASTLANVDEPTGHTGELARRFTPVHRPTLLRILLGFSPENRGDGRGTRRRYSRASIACDRGSRALDVGSYRPGPWASCTVREADGDARSRLARASRPFAREPGVAVLSHLSHFRLQRARGDGASPGLTRSSPRRCSPRIEIVVAHRTRIARATSRSDTRVSTARVVSDARKDAGYFPPPPPNIHTRR